MDIFYCENGHFDSLCLNSVWEREKKQPESAFLPWRERRLLSCLGGKGVAVVLGRREINEREREEFNAGEFNAD
jgi:hypothetical protein